MHMVRMVPAMAFLPGRAIGDFAIGRRIAAAIVRDSFRRAPSARGR